MVTTLPVGQLQTNCYLVSDEISQKAVIIDPGDEGDFIIQKIQDLNLKPQFILATHGHFDHLLAVTELRLAFNIPFLMNEKDLFLLKRLKRSTLYFTGLQADPLLPPDKFIKAGEEIQFGQKKLKILSGSGHTPGSVVFYGKGHAFVGDSLKWKKLPPQTLIHPGHGKSFTLK